MGSSQNNETCIRTLGADRHHELDTVYVRKLDIHKNDISLVLAKIVDRLASTRSLCY